MKFNNLIFFITLHLALIISFLIPATSLAQPSTEEHFSYPAEWEKQEAVWLSWRGRSNNQGGSESKAILIVNMIKELTPYVKVNLFVDTDSTKNDVLKRLKKNGIDENKVELVVFPNPYGNVRDPGPVFLKSNKGNLAILDVKWNLYGTLDTSHKAARRIDTMDVFVARKLNLPVRKTFISGEGGNREFNGKGVMMAVESSELSRNKGLSRNEIEKELLRAFGQKKMIWLGKGPISDDETKNGKLPGDIYPNGPTHIDGFCRFASANTILLAQVTKEEAAKDTLNKMSYERLESNFRILQNATDQDGKRFTIIRMPVPETIIRTGIFDSSLNRHRMFFFNSKHGDTLRYMVNTSYLNFLITNGAVLTASYWKPGRPEIMKQKDKQAKEILQKAFPGRKIIQINVEEQNEGGGGIHCATQQQPARGL